MCGYFISILLPSTMWHSHSAATTRPPCSHRPRRGPWNDLACNNNSSRFWPQPDVSLTAYQDQRMAISSRTDITTHTRATWTDRRQLQMELWATREGILMRWPTSSRTDQDHPRLMDITIIHRHQCPVSPLRCTVSVKKEEGLLRGQGDHCYKLLTSYQARALNVTLFQINLF